MEARQTLRGSDLSKGLLVALATSVVIGLAVAGSLVVKDITSPRANVNSTVHAAPGTILRQDNPVQAAQQGGPNSDLTRALPVEAARQGGPDSDLTRALPVEAAAAPATVQDQCEWIGHHKAC